VKDALAFFHDAAGAIRSLDVPVTTTNDRCGGGIFHFNLVLCFGILREFVC